MKTLIIYLVAFNLQAIADSRTDLNCVQAIQKIKLLSHSPLTYWASTGAGDDFAAMAPRQSNNWGVWLFSGQKTVYCKLPKKPDFTKADRQFFIFEVPSEIFKSTGEKIFLELADCRSTENCQPSIGITNLDQTYPEKNLISGPLRVDKPKTSCHVAKGDFLRTQVIKEVRSRISASSLVLRDSYQAELSKVGSTGFSGLKGTVGTPYTQAMSECQKVPELSHVTQMELELIKKWTDSSSPVQPTKTNP